MEKNSKQWVKVRWVKKVTGWNNNDLRAARRQGLIEVSVNPADGIRYNIQSIPERLLIISKNHQNANS